ncbi:hypothetical protein [Pasteurella phage PHB01]|uniref:Uncharacterized protein n=2 Tax=Wuhanvirus TaxID=2731989 RepID=A0A218M4G0_9CAUD|nr:hypothetical protein HOR82_gp27 [Pasteurella phage vB_PmuP_PHB02]YP_009790805.1 hypothetical protein HOR83_gp19 [Pasteurella phage PHB01]ARV77591.1 hypothetical protein [Pasteurella phage vB_PmuP_PHB02]ASD51033.1 hypothetical protein [Pasteurella phage PHB01]
MIKLKRHATIGLTDTIDAYERKIHINTLGDKVTLVFRWRSRSDGKRHTQRTTLPPSTAILLANQLMVTSTLAGTTTK